MARLIYDKGIAEYIEAIRILKRNGLNARFQLLGAPDPKHKRGVSMMKIQEWVDSGTVEYLGSTDDVRQFIAQADCIVLPSYREGTPRVLLEAAALQKPSIATDVPGCREVVQDQINGLLCELKNPIDLANKMRTMLSFDRTALDEMGVNGRKRVERLFQEDFVIRAYERALEGVTEFSPFKPIASRSILKKLSQQST